MPRQRTRSDFWVDVIIPVGVTAVLGVALSTAYLHWRELPRSSDLVALKKMMKADAVNDASTVP